jgi:hypothetical protein
VTDKENSLVSLTGFMGKYWWLLINLLY